MKHTLLSFISLLLITACGLHKNESTLKFTDKNLEEAARKEALEAKNQLSIQEKKNFIKEKNRVWASINSDGKESFKNIKSIVQKKCFDCHDANTKLPFYGNIFKEINPVTKHQVEGLKSLDFSQGFPFKARGNPPQISLLKAIRDAVVKRSMPVKSYTLVYPHKKINDEDEKKLLDWIDPLIERYTDYDQKYNSFDTTPKGMAHKILELKCFRCHANGNYKGNFGDMQDTDALLKSQYVNLDIPEQSKILNVVSSGTMPPDKMETLTADEINTIREWIEAEAKRLSEAEADN
jgi:hypothetical protein